MKIYVSFVAVWYLFLTVLPMVSSITLPIYQVATGLVAVWFYFACFALGTVGYTGSQVEVQRQDGKTVNLRGVWIPVAFGLSAYAAWFYTGNTPSELAKLLLSGASTYAEYQRHFESGELAAFGAEKILPIFSLALLKGLLIFSFIGPSVSRERLSWKQVVLASSVALAYLMFALARGTSVEIFEVFVLLLFSIALRSRTCRWDLKRLAKGGAAVLLVGLLGLVLYEYNMWSRLGGLGGRPCITAEICFEENGALASVAPGLGHLTYRLAGYFVFGVFYLATFFEEIVLYSMDGFYASLMPFGFYALHDDVRGTLCGAVIDCGVAWEPDVVKLIGTFGLPLSLAVVGGLGYVARRGLRRAAGAGDVWMGILSYYVFVFMVSMPFGNLAFLSSANKLVFLVVMVRIASAPVAGACTGYRRRLFNG